MESNVSATGLEGLEHTVQLTHEWINNLDTQLGWNDKKQPYRLLKAVLHALRDYTNQKNGAPSTIRSMNI